MCNGLGQIDGTDFYNSVVRDGFGGNLTLNFQSKPNLRSILAGLDDLNCGKIHGENNVLGIGVRLAQGSSPYPSSAMDLLRQQRRR